MQKLFSIQNMMYLSVAGIILIVGVVATKQQALAQVLLSDCDNDLDVAGETYILQNDITGTCRVLADNITIDGNGEFIINGYINADGDAGSYAYDGFSVTIQNTAPYSPTIVSANGDGAGAHGGNITIVNASVYSATAVGTYEGGTGGTVTLQNSTAYDVDVRGASAAVPFEGNGGDGGAVILDNSRVSHIIFAGGGVADYGFGGHGGSVELINDSYAWQISAIGGDSGLYGYGGNGGNVSITDSSAVTVNNTGATDGDFSLVNSAPIITLDGDNPLEIEEGDTYVEPGFSAIDIIDGDLGAEVVITGSVGTALGEYILTYTVEDETSLSATVNGIVITATTEESQVQRTVIRIAGPQADTSPRRSSGGRVSAQFLQNAGITLSGDNGQAVPAQSTDRNTRIMELLTTLDKDSDGNITRAGFIQFIMGLIEILR